VGSSHERFANYYNEAAKLRREILMRVGNGLGIYYGDVLKEAIPD
jgi:hypothetical protein